MAKKAEVKEKYAGPKGPMKVSTPYPKETKKSDIDFIGNELVKLTNRINELELNLESMIAKVKVVSEEWVYNGW